MSEFTAAIDDPLLGLKRLWPEKILVVDDDRFILKALKVNLSAHGYDVMTAENGAEAIRIMRNLPIAMIICDQRLPGMSGIEVLQRAEAICPDAIRIALTGHSDLETVLSAINIGHVAQFIIKPWEDAILNQIISNSLEKYRLIKENQNLHQLIVAQHKDLARAHETLRYQLQLGRQIHEELLLGQVPASLPGMSIAAATVPSQEIDGDFFDFYRASDQYLDLAVGDVMGKGIPAALVGTALKSQLQRFALPFYQAKYSQTQGIWQDDLLTPVEILKHTHDEITQKLMELEYFVCLFYGRFDWGKREFAYVDCGSTKPIHYVAKTDSVRFLKGVDLPIGVGETNEYHQLSVSWGKDDIFVFYSDGLTESASPAGELFGVQRLSQLVLEHHELSAGELLAVIKKAVLSYAQKDGFDDDLTIIVVKINDASQTPQMHIHKAKFAAELSQLAAIRDFVKRVCQQAPGDGDALADLLQLAINEAFCNIVKHSYRDKRFGEVVIQSELQDEGLQIDITDHGEPFDPSSITEPSLLGDQENGYGLYIMRQIADRMVYYQKSGEEGSNRLRIFKRYIFREAKMEFAHSTQENILIVTPRGESLDAREAREFKDKVLDLIGSNDSRNVVLNLQQLQFIDSSGLGSFLAIMKNLHSQGGELKLAEMNKPIRTIFELVSMHKIFEIFNTTEDAVRSFK